MLDTKTTPQAHPKTLPDQAQDTDAAVAAVDCGWAKQGVDKPAKPCRAASAVCRMM